MESINDRLRAIAREGSDDELEALLLVPDCDARSKNKDGMTALMFAAWRGRVKCVQLLLPVSDATAKSLTGMTALMSAAWRGRETCVRLLLPVSDAVSKSNKGLTASDWAREEKHESLAQFIDAYTLAQSELASMTVAARKVAPRGRSAPRV